MTVGDPLKHLNAAGLVKTEMQPLLSGKLPTYGKLAPQTQMLQVSNTKFDVLGGTLKDHREGM